jgi:ribose 5-phosphate isomerase B
MVLRLALAADHGGFVLKTGLIPWLESQNYEVLDLGADIFDSTDDYPDFADDVAETIISGKADRGILVCGSGVGASIAANKIPGIRACLCHDTYSAHQGVEHDDMNVLCLGGRVIGIELAKELVNAFLKAQFTDTEKYRRRVDKIIAIESRNLKRVEEERCGYKK